jgi:phospholipid N-methyltransferase
MTPESGSAPSGPAARPAPRPTDARRAFLAAALRRPATMGAVAPSSERLAAVLASIVPSRGEPVVVELGPGTGAVSAVIARRLPPGGAAPRCGARPGHVAYLNRTRPELEVVQATRPPAPPAGRARRGPGSTR